MPGSAIPRADAKNSSLMILILSYTHATGKSEVSGWAKLTETQTKGGVFTDLEGTNVYFVFLYL